MLSSNLLFSIGATIAGFGGIFILRNSWARAKRSVRLNTFGWGFLVFSLYLWCFHNGVDRAVAMGLLTIILLSLLFILHAYSTAPRRAAKDTRTKGRATSKNPVKTNPKQYFETIGMFVVVVFGCGAAAYIAAMGMHELMLMIDAELSDSLVLSLFMFPILWATFATIFLITDKIKSKIALITVPSGIGACLLYLGN